MDFIFEMQEDIERLYFDNQELRKMSDGQFVNQIIQDKSSRIRSANNQLIFQFRYGMAKTRIQNQLSYRLGQTMIMNSKNFIGVVFMPILLLSTLIVFKQEQKAYVDRISKDPSLKLPLLEEYPDYREAIKVKKHLSYKLGEAIIVQFKRWYKGGLFILPFALVKIYREHKGR
ncbi:TPA: alpha-2,3-sialyltransferase, partial [Campylobacter coli]|nr:alpha-2,3-sialyltransferase [Campylobacter coli]